MNELFNSPFELSLRVLIILNTAQLRLTIDKIVAYDFISTYSSDFGISESNLHGNNSYRFSEYTTKRIIITQSIKNLVLEGFIENEIPEIDYSNVNLIHFTKNANTGRYGFLIDVMD